MHESQIGSRERVLASLSPSLMNLITEITLQNVCHSLFVRKKSPTQSTLVGRGFHKRYVSEGGNDREATQRLPATT